MTRPPAFTRVAARGAARTAANRHQDADRADDRHRPAPEDQAAAVISRPAEGFMASSMGVAELGLNLFFEAPPVGPLAADRLPPRR